MIRRVLMATINYDHAQIGMEAAFKGIFGPGNVEIFDYCQLQREGIPIPAINQMFVDMATRFTPDLVWMQTQETKVLMPFSFLEIKKRLPGCLVTHWTGDMRKVISEYMAAVCQSTDITFASSVGQLPEFLAAGAKRAEYLQIGVDFAEDVQGFPFWDPPFRVPDVVLCGNWYGDTFPGTREREDVVTALMRAGIDVGVVGTGWPSGFPVAGQCGVKQQHHIWRKCKVALNVNHFNNIDRYYSDRQLIGMASGKPMVCWAVPDLQQEFKDGVHCLFASSPEVFLHWVKVLLGDPKRAEEVGKAGRAEILKNHTWFSRILNTLPMLESEQKL